MATRWYRLGTVAATNGTNRIDGTGTLWVTGTALKPQAGDLFTIDFANFYEVEGIVSDTEINIYDTYRGANVTGSTYAIVRNASVSINTRVANMVSQALNQKQRMLDEFDTWLTEKVIDPVTIHDSLGNAIELKPLPILIKEMQNLIDDGGTVIPDLVQEAKDAAALSKRWASDPENTEVEPGLYSSFHYSVKSSNSASNAENSATDSETAATASQTSETNSKASETNAKASETAAATSATQSQGFRNEAETFRDEAEASAISSAASAVASAGSATKSEQWANYSYNNPVPGETEYSSKHYSVVAFNEAERAKQYADGLNAVLVYQGVWDPSTGAYPADQPPGFTGTQFWIVSKDASFDGINWKSGDNIVWNRTNTNWDRIEAAQVYSVNGERGAVVLGTDKIPFNNAGTNIVGTTAEAAIKELDDRAESSTAHAVSSNFTIPTSDLENFTYTVLNLSGGNFTVTIPDYQAPFSAVIELIPTATLTGPVTLVAGGSATIISGDITFPSGQFGYIRLVLAGVGPRGNTWIPTSGRYIGSDFSSGLARATSFDASGAKYSVPGDDLQTSLAAVLAGRLVDAVDANTLTGKGPASFGQLAATQSWTGSNTFKNVTINANGNALKFEKDGTQRDTIYWNANGVANWILYHKSNGDLSLNPQGGQNFLVGDNKVWHAGNDGASSGLDADLLDGKQGSAYALVGGSTAQNFAARSLHLQNLEKSELTADGQLGFDSSQGLLIYRAQQGTNGSATSVLDGWNVAAGNGINISNLGAGGTGTEEFTFSADFGTGSTQVTAGNHQTSDLHVYPIVGNSGGTAGVWTGTHSGITAYKVGLMVNYRIKTAGVGAGSKLNINGLGAKPVYISGTGKVTTHFPVDSNIGLVYSDEHGGCWYLATRFYYSDANYNLRYNGTIDVGSTVHGYQLLLEGVDGKFYPVTEGGSTGNTNKVSTHDFKATGMMIFYNSSADLAAGKRSASNFYFYGEFNTMEYWNNRDSGWAADGEPIYLRGTIQENGSFRLDNSSYTSFLTQTLPTSEDGFVYMRIGLMDNTYDVFELTTAHPVYEYRDGAIREWGAGGGGAGGLPSPTVVTGNTVGEVGESYLFNISAPTTFTLPTGSTGDIIYVGDYNKTFSSTNPLTITSSENIESGSGDFYLVNANAKITLQYIDATVGWKIMDGIGESGATEPPKVTEVIKIYDNYSGQNSGTITAPDDWDTYDEIKISGRHANDWGEQGHTYAMEHVLANSTRSFVACFISSGSWIGLRNFSGNTATLRASASNLYITSVYAVRYPK